MWVLISLSLFLFHSNSSSTSYHARIQTTPTMVENKLIFLSLSFFLLYRSTIDTNHYRLYRGLCYSGRLEPKVAMYVFRWKSTSRFNMVQEWQEGKQIVTFSRTSFPLLLAFHFPRTKKIFFSSPLSIFISAPIKGSTKEKGWRFGDDKMWLIYKYFPLWRELFLLSALKVSAKKSTFLFPMSCCCCFVSNLRSVEQWR